MSKHTVTSSRRTGSIGAVDAGDSDVIVRRTGSDAKWDIRDKILPQYTTGCLNFAAQNMAGLGGDGGRGGHGHTHGHGHGSGPCSCEHDHDDDSDERGTLFSLYLKIDTDRVRCLNEAHDGSAKTIFKPWHERLDREKFVESDVDPELLLHIPFTGDVKLKGVIVIGGEDDTHPSIMKLYKNRPDMTFDDAGCEPDQEFEIHPDSTGAIEYATKAARFNSVHHLSILFPRNFGAETTKIYYIGLRGDFTQAYRQEILVTTYEARANPADHKTVNLLDSVPREIQ